MAKIVAENTAAHPDLFEKDVQMWVYEETVSIPKGSRHYDPSFELAATPQRLTTIINTVHENVKYLPNITLPTNLVANPSLTDAVQNSTILVFNVPHQFVKGICDTLKGHILPFARGISCIKGVSVHNDGVKLFSEEIASALGIYCGALSGANIANEVAEEKFSETTIAYDPPEMDSREPSRETSRDVSRDHSREPSRHSTPSSSHTNLHMLQMTTLKTELKKLKPRPIKRLTGLPRDFPPLDHDTLKQLFHRPYFHVSMVSDVVGVSLGGALKNVVALAAGFVDGKGWGNNARAAIMRVGLMEMVRFGVQFFGDQCHPETFTEESSGVADLITSCSGGRNHKCAMLAVKRGVRVEEVEKAELNGQSLQGTLTAREVNEFLKARGKEHEFPLFTSVFGKSCRVQLPSLS